MTSTTRGPLPPAVYWRRRLFVGGTLLALVLLAVDLVRGDPDPPDPDVSASATAATQQDDDAAARQARREARQERKQRREERAAGRDDGVPEATTTPPPAPVLVEPEGRCPDAEVSVTPSVTGAVAGQPVTISLSLRGTEVEACTWHVSKDHLEVKVTDDDGEVWTTRECPSAVPSTPVVVRSAATSTITMTWSSRRSDPECSAFSAYADVGDYTVTASAFGAEPGEADFTLAEPVAPAPGRTTGKQGRGRR